MKFGLETMGRLCAALGHPERSFTSILIAGTNGKGSVTAMVHQGLLAAGHRAGRYTSPHLERLEERYVIGGEEVGTDRLRAAAGRVREASEALLQRGDLEAPPTFFEAATAIAFELFREAGVRLAVLEVGLGGRLDATNVVSPAAVAITSIALDHQAQLGDTVEAIAFEKAGVIRPGIPVVCGPLPPGADSVVAGVCRSLGARLVRAPDCVDIQHVAAGATLALRGRHQQENAAVAACLLRELDALGFPIGPAAIRSGLTQAAWPGRLELFSVRGAEVLLDAAHNPAGARALAAYLREAGWDDAVLVFGAMRDKDVPGMLAELAPVCRRIICTTPGSPRALAAESTCAVAEGIAGAGWTASATSDPVRALEEALGIARRVVVAGSIFLMGPLRGILRTA